MTTNSELPTSIQLFHWDLPHPIIVSSSPLSAHGRAINNLLSVGAAAVVTKTITLYPDVRTGGCSRHGELLFNRDGYSNRSVSDWESDLDALQGHRVIANVFAETPDELANLACRVTARGVEILELGLSCPTVGKDPICCYPDQLGEFCHAVRKAVNVPILVKLLLQMSSERNREMALTVKNAGCNGICISDTLPAMILKSDGSKVLGGPGGLSGAALKPLVLKALHDIADIDLVILGIGGIKDAQDVVDYLRMGATAVQVCSVLIMNGIQKLEDLVQDFIALMGQTQAKSGQMLFEGE